MTDEMKLLLAEYGFNKSALARAVGVTPQAVVSWYECGSIPAGSAVKIETITGGKYKAIDLCKESH